MLGSSGSLTLNRTVMNAAPVRLVRRARARERNQNIHHRNDYLWLFLARSEEHGEDAEDNRSEHHERRELAA
jgi:hypothetical protein